MGLLVPEVAHNIPAARPRRLSLPEGASPLRPFPRLADMDRPRPLRLLKRPTAAASVWPMASCLAA